MGAASLFEDHFTRYLAGVDPPLPAGGPADLSFECPYCGRVFANERGLFDHLDEHRGQRPLLLIGGREPGRRAFIRRKLKADDVRLVHCTSARTRIDGATSQVAALALVPQLVANQRDATLDVELLNHFEPKAEPIAQSYCLTFIAPDQQALDGVDQAFIANLATGSPHMAQVDAFLTDRRCKGPARDYADALSSYVVGVLTRDQAPATGATLRPAEGAALYGSALVRLRGFQRLLPSVICALIQFAKNEFARASRPTGIVRLDNARAILLPLVGVAPPAATSSEMRGRGRMITLCPIDQGTDRILDLGERLRRLTRWGRQTQEECEQAADSGTLDAADRDKVLALWAATALRLDAEDSAKPPLRRLRNSFPFGPWADGELERTG